MGSVLSSGGIQWIKDSQGIHSPMVEIYWELGIAEWPIEKIALSSFSQLWVYLRGMKVISLLLGEEPDAVSLRFRLSWPPWGFVCFCIERKIRKPWAAQSTTSTEAFLTGFRVGDLMIPRLRTDGPNSGGWIGSSQDKKGKEGMSPFKAEIWAHVNVGSLRWEDLGGRIFRWISPWK